MMRMMTLDAAYSIFTLMAYINWPKLLVTSKGC
jgi:hypothetical protein